jgi:hypothetical protein
LLNCKNFTFEGQSSADFDIFLGHIGDPGTVTDALYDAEIVEERIPSQISPIFFGLDVNKPVTRQMVLCSNDYLSREKIDEIFQWLTCSTAGYGKLTIDDDDDLSDYEFHVIFQNLQLINSGWPIAIACTVVFDSQWAYVKTTPRSFQVRDGKILSSTGLQTDTVLVDNESSYLGYIYPKLTLQIEPGVTDFAIINQTDDQRKLTFHFPEIFTPDDGSGKLIITVDNRTKLMTSNASDVNPYRCLADNNGYYHFFRLCRGKNRLSFTGSGVLTIAYNALKGVGL